MADQHQLPLFPLEQVLYPSGQLPLHIFEPRYKELAAYCLEENAPFGILLLVEDELVTTGCSADIDEILQEYDNGEMDILVRGSRRFQVLEVYDSDSYLTADISYIEEPPEDASPALRERAITQHMKLLELAGRTVRPSVYEDVQDVSYLLAQNAGMDNQQQQHLLELLTADERMTYLINYFEDLLPKMEEAGDLRRRIQSNGHFKDFPLEG